MTLPLPRHLRQRKVRRSKHSNHFRIVEIEDIPQATQDIVVVHQLAIPQDDRQATSVPQRIA
jgi:hypothetical protein